MLTRILFISIIFVFACKSKYEKIKPSEGPITESIYASGLLKSKNQYEAFVTVSGNIEHRFVSEGDFVKAGTPILFISDEAQRLGKENAELMAQFSDLSNNKEKLNDAKVAIGVSKANLMNDSILYIRQKTLWDQQVGTKVEYEARELAYQNSKAAHYSAVVKYDDLKRQLDFNASQSKKNLLISSKLESDYTLRSKIDGIVYSLLKEEGEIVNPQTPLAVIGDAKKFILEMQVDEYDILKVRIGLPVLVTMDSYKGKVFEARVTKIYPMMNQTSKTFLVEAEFTKQPEILYPNISFEANILLQTKDKALLIPRSFMVNDSSVVKSNGDTVKVKTGLKDYKKIEILSGISQDDELKGPKQ